jgi:hypothetical protein
MLQPWHDGLANTWGTENRTDNAVANDSVYFMISSPGHPAVI